MYAAPPSVEIIQIVKEYIELVEEPTPQELVSNYAEEYGVDLKLANAIISCESRYNENAIGTLAVVGEDVGLWQINSYFHKQTALSMGLDIYKVEDNIKYGFYLLSTEGVRHWYPSKLCWSAKLG